MVVVIYSRRADWSPLGTIWSKGTGLSHIALIWSYRALWSLSIICTLGGRLGSICMNAMILLTIYLVITFIYLVITCYQSV